MSGCEFINRLTKVLDRSDYLEYDFPYARNKVSEFNLNLVDTFDEFHKVVGMPGLQMISIGQSHSSPFKPSKKLIEFIKSYYK